MVGAVEVVVVGQGARDLVLRAEGIPPDGGSVAARTHWEGLGGKGANQAVGLAQSGLSVALVCALGEDAAGEDALMQASRDGLDVSAVARRGRTALLLDVLVPGGVRRLFEDVPESSLVTPGDVAAAGGLIAAADTVSVQLQQPHGTALAAARRARAAGARVVADGAQEPDALRALLPLVDVLRADAREAEMIAGGPVTTADQARTLARDLIGAGPSLVALALPEVGDVLVSAGDSVVLPRADVPVADPTGAGDAFTAGLITALRRTSDLRAVGRHASAAAAATVQRVGGRPDLSRLRPPGGP